MKKLAKRQQIRRRISFLMFLLFPVYINFLSPVLILGGAYEGLITGSLIFFALLFISTLFFGRLWCGWLCPAGAMQEACHTVSPKYNTKKWGLIFKYTYWVIWLGMIVWFFIKAGGIKGSDILYGSDTIISIMNDPIVIVYLGVVILVYVMSLTLGQNSFCKYLCWMSPFMAISNKLRNTLHIPGLRLKTSPDACISCGLCTKTCPMSIDVQKLIVQKTITDVDCHMCYQCADVCPKNCIR